MKISFFQNQDSIKFLFIYWATEFCFRHKKSIFVSGVQDRLDYIQGIGIQCILLNPMFMSLSGNSFAVTDFTNIDPAVGTLQDFDNLVTAAHARSMS